MLCSPHNPLGRVLDAGRAGGAARPRPARHGVRVIADEIHGAADAAGRDVHAVPRPSTRSAILRHQRVEGVQHPGPALRHWWSPSTRPSSERAPDRAATRRTTLLARSGWSRPWRRTPTVTTLAGRARRATRRPAHAARRAARRTRLPEARMRPLEATYLPWLDLRAVRASTTSPGRPWPTGCGWPRARTSSPGSPGHVRLNMATSRPNGSAAIVDRLAAAVGDRQLPRVTSVRRRRSGAATSAPPTPRAWPSSATRCSASRSTPRSWRMLAAGQGAGLRAGARPSCSAEHVASGRLRFTDSYEEAGAFGEIHFLCVGTPAARATAWARTSARWSTPSSTSAPHLTGRALLVGKSTVPVGTAERMAARLDALVPRASTRSWPGTPSSCARASPSRTPCGPTASCSASASRRPRSGCASSTRRCIDHGTPVVVTDYADRRAGEGHRQRLPGHQDLLHQRRRRGVRGRRAPTWSRWPTRSGTTTGSAASSSAPASASAAAACRRTSARSCTAPASSASRT